jgi:hypothetical protein
LKINAKAEAAVDLYRKGFTPIRVIAGTKATARNWDTWTANLDEDKIRHEFNRNPADDIGILLEENLFIVDADTPQGVAALHMLNENLDLDPGIIVQTSRGEHHYYLLGSGVYARSQAPWTSHSSDDTTGPQNEAVS